MVKLPPEFVATRLFGYFWNTKTQRLYSIKVSGVLRELAITRPNKWNELNEAGYRVSDKGRRKFLPVSQLKMIPVGQDSTIPVEIKIDG